MSTTENFLEAVINIVRSRRRYVLISLSIAVALATSGCGSSSAPQATSPTSAPGGSGESYCDNVRVVFGPSATEPVATVSPPFGALADQRNHVPLTGYAPDGIADRSPQELRNPVLPPQDRSFALHSDVRNSDEVLSALAPVFEHVWTAEPGLYIPEGPSFGEYNLFGASNFFFSGTEADLALFALDRLTGIRQWAVVPGQTGQTGATLVLKEPRTGENIVYGGGARALFAVSEDGVLQWCSDTGLDFPVDPFEGDFVHVFGVNYHVATDTVVAAMTTGDMVAFDRETGELVGRFRIPGAPSVPGTADDVPDAFVESADRAMRRAYVPEGADLPDDFSLARVLIDAILGGGNVIANFFSTDPDSDLIWIAATLDDLADGVEDGQAGFGALYGLKLSRAEGADAAFSIHCAIPFEGGSASTPGVEAGGERIYTADAFGNVLAYDKDCNQLWKTKVGRDEGEQVVASITVSSTDDELFAVTPLQVVKITDQGDEGRIEWRAQLDQAFTGGPLLLAAPSTVDRIVRALGFSTPVSVVAANMTTAMVAENVVAVAGGLGIKIIQGGPIVLPLSLAMILLDRDTGEVVNATGGQEESIGALVAGRDGDIYLGNSPLRRAALRGLVEPGEGGVVPAPLDPLTSNLIPPLIGGYSRYAAVQGFDQHARDAACFAQRRLEAWLRGRESAPHAFADSVEALTAESLVGQALRSGDKAVERGELGSEAVQSAAAELDKTMLEIQRGDPAQAREAAAAACTILSEER